MASTGHGGDHGRGGRTGSSRRPSPAIYRRRRLVVILLALLVVAALAVGGAALAGALGRGQDTAAGDPPAPVGTPSADPTPSAGPTASATTAPAGLTATPTPGRTPTPGATPSPSASATSSSAADACDPGTVVVEAETDRQEYGPDDTVVLTLVVRNTGDTACSVNVGTSQMEFLVTSGDERVFSSIDCQQASQDLEHTIEAGADERARFEWSRNRSMPGCTPADETPGAGGYTLTTKLGVRDSSPVEFTLR
ncbi:hypothetical protein ACX80N_08495 [Arthrobacter sp. MDT2-16]